MWDGGLSPSGLDVLMFSCPPMSSASTTCKHRLLLPLLLLPLLLLLQLLLLLLLQLQLLLLLLLLLLLF